MSHFDTKTLTRRTKAEATDVTWLAAGAQIGQLANIWSGRSDLIAYVGPGAGNGSPACFTPATAEVDVDVTLAFGAAIKPEDIGDLRIRATQYEWPKAVGVIFHEALHARFSSWDIQQAQKDLTQAEFRALVFLEEGRIESQGLELFPENAGFLRACVLQIVMADLADEPLPENNVRAAASLAALTLARVDAGSVLEEDCEVLREVIVKQLGEEVLEKLRALWLQMQSHTAHSSAIEIYPIAKEWVRILNELAGPEDEEGSGKGEGGRGKDEDGDDIGSGEGLGGALGELLDALAEAADTAEIESHDDLNDQQTAEEWKEEATARQGTAKRTNEHKQAASEVFGKGTGPDANNKTSSSLRDTRSPSGPERAVAVRIAQLLEKAKYRDRDETEITSVLPPGRLRTRAMVQSAAFKARGAMTQVEPWRRTKRKHVDDPTLTVGVMVDISGSMGYAMEPMAVTAWVMSEAVRRVQGKAAMIYFGSGVFSTLSPGQHLDKVQIYSAPDGTEKFNQAFKALDGSVGLLNGTGARLLVVVSDACYVGEEIKAAGKWVLECERAGVGVLWLSIDNGYHARALLSGTKAVVLANTTNPVEVATEIGMAAATALTAAGRG